nr:HWE histidine kinase domain-containing protein [Leptolyngbyaceae cyanobacterium MO_188.B28]
GLRFPAADVPEQVRDLALKISLRVIPDIHANPVQLLAFDRTEQPLDLSLTHVRGVVPLHLEYLANMGIEASMTLEILLNGELWGLFAFHHRQPKLLSPAFRSTIELFGRLFSLLLQQRLSAAHVHDLRRTAAEIANILVAQLDSENWQTLAMDIQSQLCQLFSAHGVAFVSSQGITTYGEVPPQPAIVTLVKTHHTDIKPNIIKIDNLQQTGPNTIQNWDISAGALIIELSLTELSHVVFFRNEIIREIRWAGNPEKKTIVDTSLGPRLCPRASFEEYKETVRGHCHPWSSYNLTAAHELQTQLIRYAVDRAQFFQQRRQDLLVAELNHRVKNVLALIRSVARQTQASTTSLPDYANLLESRIAALAMAHDLVAEHGLEWLTLHELITTELRPYSMASESRVTLLGQDVGLKANFIPTFVLVLHELISNAAKYGALSTSQGRLTVQWFERNEGLCIHWREAQGPLVQEPKHRGFGLTLIERAIPYEFEGETILRFNPSGVEADFWLPRHLIQWRPKQKEFRRNLTASSSLANALPETSADYTQGTALVVEDNIMLAMEMENILKYLGFEPIDCAPSTARALKLMEKNRYRICLLDINLKQETSFEIAQTLMAKQIPFIFTSGYQSYHVIPDQLQRYPLLKKPIDATTLDTTISKLLNS